MDSGQWLDQVTRVECWRYDAALTVTLPTRFGPIASRQGLMLRWETNQGILYSEAAPFPGLQTQSLSETFLELQRQLSQPDAIDIATLSPPVSLALGAIAYRLSEPVLSGSAPPVCGLLSEGQPLSPRLAAFDTLKLKLQGNHIEPNAALIRQVLDGLESTASLRLDCAGNWSRNDLLTLLAQIPEHRIAYIEDPFAALSDYSQWTQDFTTPFALDDLASQWLSQPTLTGGLAALVVKPLVMGFATTQLLAKAAQRAGIDVVLSSVYESSVQLNFYYWLAQQWKLSAAQGFDTGQYWQADMVEHARCDRIIRPLMPIEDMEYLGRLR